MTTNIANSANSAGVYGDFSGLEKLKSAVRQQDPSALRQVAQQFESLFAKMMLKSMRKAIGKGQGDTVTIYVLSPQADFSVPKLVGDTTSQAAGILGQAGLTLGPTMTKACSNSIGIGLVTGSNPAEGAFVNAGERKERRLCRRCQGVAVNLGAKLCQPE